MFETSEEKAARKKKKTKLERSTIAIKTELKTSTNLGGSTSSNARHISTLMLSPN
ncbi:hypothetical protein [Aerococcus urinae]